MYMYNWYAQNPHRRSLEFKGDRGVLVAKPQVWACDVDLMVGKFLNPDSDVTVLETFPELAKAKKLQELERLQKELAQTPS